MRCADGPTRWCPRSASRAWTVARSVPTVLYDALFSTLATRVDAELAHRVGLGAIRAVGAVPGARVVLSRALQAGLPASATPVHAMGLRFRSPLGLAAGFDKDGVGVLGLAALGFGFVEIGTVTPRAQPGNPTPRVFRLPADRALVNRLGFNNGGAADVADRLRRTREDPAFPADLVVGLNIGRNRTTPDADAVTDYATGARLLAPVADYLVVNVSSPNTPGLRDLQAVDRLRPVLSAVLAEARAVPVLVKIAPDLADADVDAVADLADDAGLAGIVATNTTVSRVGLHSSAAAVAEAGSGGLSGPPLRARSLAVVERLARRAGDRLTVVAAGGIGSGADARRALDAGAVLVQAYTGFVYGGPLWPRRVTRELAARH